MIMKSEPSIHNISMYKDRMKRHHHGSIDGVSLSIGVAIGIIISIIISIMVLYYKRNSQNEKDTYTQIN